MNIYKKTKGKASEKTKARKAEKNRGVLVWTKGTYVKAKHGELK